MPGKQNILAHRIRVGNFPQPRQRLSHIHIDVVGPLPQSEGARYLLTIIDRSTCWLDVTPMEEASTASCAEALLSSWISHFGVPDSITTDRGPAFLSELWVSLACLMGIALHSTTAYNPAANGMVERAHCSLTAALVARCTDERWKEQLPWVLLADGADTPLPRLRELAQKFVPCHKTFTDRTTTYSLPALDPCTYVFVRVDARRPPLTRPYRRPHRCDDWVTIDRLKPTFLLDSKVHKEAGRSPRVPPQYLPADTPGPPPKRGLGRPRGHIKPTPDVSSTPCPQFSRSFVAPFNIAGAVLLCKRMRPPGL
ncbi:uncharacterized protein [Macrobrachium rosenbergii]|uniref:uncharacterized protein n=1 Tax=Macrobrachium rosenbergii TaxID=79674 RepID=UPI0034D7A523